MFLLLLPVVALGGDRVPDAGEEGDLLGVPQGGTGHLLEGLRPRALTWKKRSRRKRIIVSI